MTPGTPLSVPRLSYSLTFLLSMHYTANRVDRGTRRAISGLMLWRSPTIIIDSSIKQMLQYEQAHKRAQQLIYPPTERPSYSPGIPLCSSVCLQPYPSSSANDSQPVHQSPVPCCHIHQPLLATLTQTVNPSLTSPCLVCECACAIHLLTAYYPKRFEASAPPTCHLLDRAIQRPHHSSAILMLHHAQQPWRSMCSPPLLMRINH
jgi:hypothetical protein